MTLPDNAFFELLRNVFGKIKTPFNKQMLLADLETFLLREDIQKNIACYIDLNDARVIAAVAFLDEPDPGGLASFFSGEMSYAELQDMIINLEERFIFYRFSEKGLGRIALNPILEPVLLPFITDTSLLFPSIQAAGTVSAPPPLNDRVLAGLFSFAAEGESFFKTEGGMRKRVIDAGNSVFPGLDLEPVIGGLRVLGLLRTEEDRVVPDYRRFSDFGRLTPGERLEYCAAGMYCFCESGFPADVSPFLLRAQVRNIAGFMHRFLNSLEPELVYPIKTLKRLVDILKGDRTDTTHEAGTTDDKKIDNGVLLDSLEKTGLLLPVSSDCLRLGLPAADLADAGKPGAHTAEAPVIAMDTAFSCLVYPEISYADALSLAAMISVREAGASIRFEITRDSVIRAFDRGLACDAMIELLKRLSAHRVSENLIWTLKDWEKRYGEVSLRRGLFLSLSPERRYLAETEPLARLIRETPAPGFYLLAETAEKEAAEALQKAGVDIIAKSREKDAPWGTVSETSYDPFPSPDSTGPLSHSKKLRVSIGPKMPSLDEQSRANMPLVNSAKASTLIAGFHSILEQMQKPGSGNASHFSKAEQDELAARIDRRLVLCESQLRDASVRYEKLEARGLDYVGKAMIAKQAIALQSPVEVVRTGKKAERIFGIPRALEKEGGESILVIIPQNNGTGGETLRIPLGKISLLRRIKKSIFENNS
jgi:hypothetical protein